MRRPRATTGQAPAVAFGLALAALQGCTAVDTLTPPLDVGTSGSINSQPLNDGDVQSAMRQNDGYRSHRSLQSERMPPEQAYSPPASSDGRSDGPQTSLEAQASALDRGERNPVASDPLPGLNRGDGEGPGRRSSARDLRRAPAQEDQAEAEPSGNDSHPPMASAPQATEDAAPSQTGDAGDAQAALSPQAGGAEAIRFLPIIGAPVQAVTPLSRQLGQEARERGIALRGASDQPAQHILKGYFSAYDDGNRTVVVYVWDVLDAGGNRLHRIQGQESVPGKAADPWQAVPTSTMQIIASKTMAAYQDWLGKGRG